MRLRCLLAVCAAVSSVPSANADEKPITLDSLRTPRTEYSSVNVLSRRAVHPGAVYQIRLRVPPDEVSKHLRAYDYSYLPVDQFVCDAKFNDNALIKGKCESSGRKLVSVLSREFGDEHNLVFLYRYEDAYKDDYYCKYPKAFLQYHAVADTLGIVKAVKESDPTLLTIALGQQPDDATKAASLGDVLAWLPAKCSDFPPDGDPRKKALAALAIVQDMLQALDLLFSPAITSSEGSWYFDVNPCKVGILTDKPKTPDAELEKKCPEFRDSMLERAVSLKWGQPWSPKE